jgi:hypothetical protein
MPEPTETNPNRQRALRALLTAGMLLLAAQLLLPAIVLKAINRQLAQANLKLSASLRISLPNRITLTNVKIQSTSEENTASAQRISVTLRSSALFRRNSQPLAHIAIHGVRGSWNLHSGLPHTNLAPANNPSPPKKIPDAFEISIEDLTLSLPPTPGASIRQISIRDLALDASTTHEGSFRIGQLKAGDSNLLSETTGETTFFNKQLSIKELKLSESNFIEHLRIDFGAVSNQPSFDFLLLRGNGYVSAKASLSRSSSGQSFSLRTDAENVKLPLDPFASTARRALPHVEIHESHTSLEGLLNNPSTWRANASLSGSLIDPVDSNKTSILAARINLSEEGLKLEQLSIQDPALQFSASASASLRDTANSLKESVSNLVGQCSLKYSATNHDSPLRQIADHFGNPIPNWAPSSQISARATQSETHALALVASFQLQSSPERPSQQPTKGALTWNAPSLENVLNGTLEIETDAFHTSLQKIPITIPPSHLRLTTLQPSRHLTLHLILADRRVPILTQHGANTPWNLAFQNIALRELLPLTPRDNPCTLSAKATITPTDSQQPTFSGIIRIADPTNGTVLNVNISRTDDAPAKLNATLLQQDSRVAVAEITLDQNPSTPNTTITSTGNLTTANAFRNILSLANFSITPSSRLAWNANATLSPQHPLPLGQISCDATGIIVGRIGPMDLKSTVQSNGSSIETQPTTLTLGETTVTGIVQWSTMLSVKDLRIIQRNRPALQGELSLHHPISKPAAPSPDTPLLASLEANQLDLSTLLGGSSPMTGKINGTMSLNGTLDQPILRGKLTSSKIDLPSALNLLNPVTLEIQAHPTPGVISLTAKLTSALNAPVEMAYTGSIHSLLSPDPSSNAATPDTFSLNLKGGSLQPLSKLNDIFKSVAGTIDVSLSAKRIHKNWEWSGKSVVKAPKILFESPRAPGLTDLTLTATIKDSTTTAVDLLTSSGGGTIRIQGDIRSPLSPNPTLDLSIKTRNVLAYRNESLLLRADSDLTFKGTWKEPSISGEAAPVQSKYLHDIEILPINLTKKGETRDRLKGLFPGFSFTQAPYSDWKFNIHFKSRPRDPMLVRGNRWQGEADVDMIWGGTGLRPWFEGYYHSKNLTAFLPSVRLAVTDGYLWYKRDTPFQGTLDVNALTTARGYRIAAYISGPLSQPDLLLTSKPALDQTDLLSLLTTGVLPSDSNDSPQVAAARATEAIAEDISRSLLGVDRRMIEGIGRVDVEFSRVNPRTGQQETRVTRRLSEDWSVSGDIGTNGDFTGRLKFLHRFK